MICETPTNHDILRQPSSIIVLSFDHRVVFYNEYLREAKLSAIFTQGGSQEGKNVGSFTHEQNIICTQRKLDDITREQTIICRQLFADHVVGSRPMKRTKNVQRMIMPFIDVLHYDKYLHILYDELQQQCLTVG